MLITFLALLDHFEFFFKETGLTMRHTNGEFTESLHSTLKKHEEIHNFKMVKNLGTPVHQSKSMTNFLFFNARRIGIFTKSERIITITIDNNTNNF